MAAKLKRVQQQFQTSDVDNDGRLQQAEFIDFVLKAYNKPCPPAMYKSLCAHFEVSTDQGLTWENTQDIFMQSNAQSRPASRAASPAAPKEQAKKSPGGGGGGGAQRPSRPGGRSSMRPQPKQSPVTPQPQSGNSPGRPQLKPASSARNVEETEKPPKLDRRPTRKLAEKTTSPMRSKSPNPVSSHSRMANNAETDVKHNHSMSLSDEQQKLALTERALHRHEYHQSMSATPDPDVLSEGSDGGGREERGRGHHASRSMRFSRSVSRLGSDMRRDSMASDEADSEFQVVALMESRLTAAKQNLAKEKARRKQVEDLAQQLVTQNEQLKQQILDLQQQVKRHKTDAQMEGKEHKKKMDKLQDSSRELKNKVDDNRATITHLQAQRDTMKSERDEAFKLLRKIEKDNETRIKKLKTKHKDEMEKLSKGFLQTLGAEPGKDVRTVILELKESNVGLQRQVDVLAETLARKEQSLLEALAAVDSMTHDEEMDQSLSHQKAHLALPALPDREVSSENNIFANLRKKKQQFKKNRTHSLSNEKKSEDPPLPPPNNPRSKNEKKHSISSDNSTPTGDRQKRQMGVTPNRNANFFKTASTTTNTPAVITPNPMQFQSTFNPNGSSVPVQQKNMQFLSQKLAGEVSVKEEKIQDLAMANSVLGSQVMELQKQLAQISQMSTGAKKQRANSGAPGHPTATELP